MTTIDTRSDYKPDYKWLRMITSKNIGELSSLTFLLQVIKGNYKPEHNQDTSGHEPNYNSANKIFYVGLQIKLTFKQILSK